jgi:hypothetical protein
MQLVNDENVIQLRDMSEEEFYRGLAGRGRSVGLFWWGNSGTSVGSGW